MSDQQPTLQPQTEPDDALLETVNVEAIMQQIRQQILAKRAAVAPDGALSDIVVAGKRLPPEFYEHLYQARLALDEYQTPVFVSTSSVPVIGGLINWFRTKFHELVVYYVNQSAARQVAATSHLIRALSALGQELEAEDGDAPRA